MFELRHVFCNSPTTRRVGNWKNELWLTLRSNQSSPDGLLGSTFLDAITASFNCSKRPNQRKDRRRVRDSNLYRFVVFVSSTPRPSQRRSLSLTRAGKGHLHDKRLLTQLLAGTVYSKSTQSVLWQRGGIFPPTCKYSIRPQSFWKKRRGKRKHIEKSRRSLTRALMIPSALIASTSACSHTIFI